MNYIIDFLKELRENNNKEWFDAHRKEYKTVQQKVELLTQQLIERMSKWDQNLVGLQPQDCLYRINRDVRFSKDKTPYKNHIGIFLAKGGKKSGFGGYYFHIEPEKNNEQGHHLLAAGTYMLENKYLKVIREDIYNEYDLFYKLLRRALPFQLDRSNVLKQTPHGFPRGQKYDKYLLLKDFCIMKGMQETFLLKGGNVFIQRENVIENGWLSEFISREFHSTGGFLSFINRAINFVKEQDTELETW
ncbi:MAG: DUF2461 domain-containing protein [Bacteroidales bacterium]|jgi:uncharacterized protein (TIGR02453 family)|nr:DUF2461 domain-containing protein [Bacteroidales bacterium]